MASYVNNLRLLEIAQGAESGTWGTKTNLNLELIGEALGFGTEALSDASTHTTTVLDGGADPARGIYQIYTGSLSQACTITIAPDDMKRVHIIKNGTSGSQNILIKQGSGGGAAVTIPPGDTKVVSLDGGGSSAIVTDVFASLSVVDLKVQDDLTLSSDSAVVTFGADGDTTLTHTDGTGLTLNSTNKLTFGDAASFIHQSADGVLTVDGEATIDLNASTAVLVSHDLKLNSDGAILGFGVDNEVTLTHVHNAGLILGGTAPSLTIGDAGEEDTKLVFDGNAQDFYVGLDDSADDLVIGKGSAVGTTPALSIDENLLVTISDDILVTDRAYGGALEAENDGSFNLAEGNDFSCTTAGSTEITFTNAKAGQSGNIKFVQSGGHTVTANALVAINADALSTLATTGTYHLAYFCTADSGNDTILVSVSGILT
tara:strand:- start:73 stop:1362 length:1290 start_codon:yes stop_codon:yes gene_type:complete